MKTIYKLFGVLLLPLVFHSCKKENNNIVKDIDGNLYTSIAIGTQIWMIENLKTTHFTDGSEIPLITNSLTWSNLNTPGFCWYNNDESTYKNPYGALYNWFAVNTGNLCPTGWHVPTKDDWVVLVTYLEGHNYTGGKLKEMGTTHWADPNLGATNESGFTGLPGGLCYEGHFILLGLTGDWWTTTPGNSEMVYCFELAYDFGTYFLPFTDKKYGCSVRCLKDHN